MFAQWQRLTNVMNSYQLAGTSESFSSNSIASSITNHKFTNVYNHCSSNLASGLCITKEAKRHLSCSCHDNSFAAGPVLIKTKIPRFYLKQGSSTLNNLMERVRTIWELFVCRAKPSFPLKNIASWDIWFFTERDWSRECCHGNNIVGIILFLL